MGHRGNGTVGRAGRSGFAGRSGRAARSGLAAVTITGLLLAGCSDAGTTAARPQRASADAATVSSPPTGSPPATSPSAPVSASTTGSRPAAGSPKGTGTASATGATAPGTRPPAPSSACATLLSSWDVSRQAAQVVTVPVESSALAGITDAVREGVGGVLLFGSAAPADLRGQLRALTAQAPGGVKPFVMSDEEGGGVQRLRNLVGALPWPRSMAATRTPAQVRDLAAATARRLRSVGVDMDLAPVLDLDAGPGPDTRHPAGRRSFGADPAVAARYGVAFAAGLRDGGVVPVVKHFPGLGSATHNTDFGAASVSSLSTLLRADLVPYRAAIAAGLPAVMVSHAAVPGLSSQPVSLSAAAVNGLLRTRMGFRGLVVTDSLSAEAVRAAGYNVPAAGVRALAAGSDLLLYGPAGATAEPTARAMVAAIVAAVRSGTLPAERLRDAVRHVLAAKSVGGC